ncbi:MAG: hypothetical protein JO013_06555 [Alphaproteobacteria bacterium]|nr:hypothetical protein [Alphaproteobacteria bacterium]
MRLTLLALTAAAAMAAPTAAPGAPLPSRVTGRALAELCNTDSGACMGYVVGAVDAFVATQLTRGNPVYFCIPPTVTNRQLTETTLAVLRAHPELANDNAGTVVVVALTAAYRCAAPPPPAVPVRPQPQPQPPRPAPRR